MMDKISELSMDRTFCLLGRCEFHVSPEKIIIYGLFFIGIVIFVNWILSLIVLIVKPFLYAALMLAVLRPEYIQSFTTEESVRKLVDDTKLFFTAFGLNVIDFYKLFCRHFSRSSNS